MIVVLISTLECCKPCTSSRLVAQKKCTVKPGLRPGPRACLGFGGLGLGPEKSQARARSGPAQARASRPSPARNITMPDGRLVAIVVRFDLGSCGTHWFTSLPP